jgi:uncharacterized membrane protein
MLIYVKYSYFQLQACYFCFPRNSKFPDDKEILGSEHIIVVTTAMYSLVRGSLSVMLLGVVNKNGSLTGG